MNFPLSSAVALAETMQTSMNMPVAPIPSLMPMPTSMTGEAMVMAPQWMTLGLGLAFLAGTLFYVFRLCHPSYLRKVNGYIDTENEFWHGLCLLAMACSLTPAIVPVPTVLWPWALSLGVVWYLVRAFTYGRKLQYNKQWYDFAHAAMFFGMWWMFVQPFTGFWVTALFAAYWSWFGSYYALRLLNDCKRPQLLTFGQDIFHFAMALVMVVMTIWPHYLMIM